MKLKVVLGTFALLSAVIILSLVLRPTHHDEVAATPPIPGPLANAANSSTVLPATNTTAATTRPRETDPAVNPYAGALKEHGRSHRAWDAGFMQQIARTPVGSPIRFELTEGRVATGTIRITQFREEQLSYLSGELTEPEIGRFFFLTPPAGSKAGLAVGVVEFWGSKTAYRVEPTGANGSPELWQRRLDEVVCLTMPLVDGPGLQETESTPVGPQQTPPLRPDLVPDYVPTYNSNIVSLQSFPGSKAVMLLDFFGGYTPTWGGVSYPPANVSNAQVKDLWKRVAEDYMPFNINVTTDIQVYQSAPANSRQRCVFTPSTAAMPNGAAGVAYIGSWDWGNDTVCWSIYTSGKNGGEVGSHEVGHTLGLGHQGTSTSGYYTGHGSGATGWGPIMGAGYYQPVITWAKGEYLDANNKEDELNIIVTQNNNVTYRTDDTGSTLPLARQLEIYNDYSVFGEGVIERSGDIDSFQFQTGGGVVSLTANPVGAWANLAVSISLVDSNGVTYAGSNPQTTLSASLSANVPAGTYAFKVSGAGRNDPSNTGFSAYGSLGYYSISGSVAGARLPTRFTIPEHLPLGASVGVVPASSPSDPLAYAIVSGNSGNAFAIDNSGLLTVANPAYLDYNQLASNTMFTVQLELFVNITNLANADLTEYSRRVAVGITNVMEPPVVAGLTNSLFEGTRVGTVVGKVNVTDYNNFPSLSYSIADGSNGAFTIDAYGNLRVSGPLSTTNQTLYTLQVVVTDNQTVPLSGTGYVSFTIMTNFSPFAPGIINFATYENIGSGMLVSDLTGNAHWPRDPDQIIPLSSLETPSNRGDNYGGAVRGFVIPPVSGSYRFWVASDDNSELWLSGTTNPATISRIAYISGANLYTGQREWTKFSSQMSTPVTLVAGQAYYLEARMKEGGGSDNLAVAWAGPATGNLTNVIPSLNLAPIPYNYRPQIAGFTNVIARDAIQGSIIGKLKVTDLNPEDTQTLAITGGSASSFCGLQAGTGNIYVKNEAVLQSLAPGNYTLLVSATDSGSPKLTGTAQGTITVLSPTFVNVTLQQEIWNNIGSGTAVSDLTNSAGFPGRPNTQLAITNLASSQNIGDNYGSRIRALLTPQQSGDFTFFVASDDSSILYLSPDDQSAHAVRIASVFGATGVGAWTTYQSQMSPTLSLVAGKKYYLEVLHKEGSGSDHVEVAWTGTGLSGTNIIPASALSAVDLNYAPSFTNQSFRISPAADNGTLVGRLIATDSPLDTLTYKLLSNPGSAFSLDPQTGDLTLTNNTAFAGNPGTTLQFLAVVQDSGYSNRAPRHATQALITVTALDPTASGAWAGLAAANDWATPDNWQGAIPTVGAGLVFGAPSLQTNLNDFLPLVSWIQFTNAGFALGVSNLSILKGITNSGDNVVDGMVTISENQTWNNISGTLSISGALTNLGAALNIVASSDVSLSTTLAGSGSLSKSGPYRLLLSGAHSFQGPITIASAGTGSALEVAGNSDLSIPGADLTLNGRLDLSSHNATIGGLNGSGTVFASAAGKTLTLGDDNASGIYSGTLINSGGSAGPTLALIKSGTGVQNLNGASSFSGGTQIRAGQIAFASATALGSGPVNLGEAQSQSNDVLLLQSSPVTLANVINVTTNGTGNAFLGTANMTAGALNAVFSGQINLSRNVVLRAGSNNRTTFSGRITGTGNVLISSPDYAGRRIVFERPTGIANDFLGNLDIDSGAILQIGATNSIGNRTIPNTSAVRFNPGAQLRIAATGTGDNESVGPLQSLAPGAGVINLISGSSFTLIAGFGDADGTFSGSLQNTSGSLAFTKTGAGTQVLAGSNSFSGICSVNFGVLVAANPFALGSATATTFINSGGTLALSNNITIATEPLTMNGAGANGQGALLNLSGSNIYNGSLTMNGAATISAVSGTLWLGGNFNMVGLPLTLNSTSGQIVFASAIGGGGSLTKSGPGLVTLNGANSYSGTTLITDGTLLLGPGATLQSVGVLVQSAGILDVSAIPGGWMPNASQSLGGSGVVHGDVVVGGSLTPGESIGTLTIDGNCQLAGITLMELDKGAPAQTNDLLRCTASLTPGGILIVTNIGTTAFALGDVFKLFDAPIYNPGVFSQIDLPPLPPSLKWDDSRLTLDGTLAIVPGDLPPQPTLVLGVDSGSLTLSWPLAYTDYVLQGQTNADTQGIGPNWYPVEGVTNNSVTLPLDPAIGSAIFRLSKP